jgi:hypothetical protein
MDEFLDKFVPMVRTLPGFLGSFILVDRESGTIRTVRFWDSKEHMDAVKDKVMAVAKSIALAAGADEEDFTVEEFEVKLSEPPPAFRRGNVETSGGPQLVGF